MPFFSIRLFHRFTCLIAAGLALLLALVWLTGLPTARAQRPAQASPAAPALPEEATGPAALLPPAPASLRSEAGPDRRQRDGHHLYL